MKQKITSKIKDVTIRTIESSDIEHLRIIRNVNREFFISSSEITPEQQKSWYEAYHERDDEFVFAIIVDEQIVGMCSLYNKEKDGSFEFGRFALDPEFKGRGIGKTSMVACCSVAFETLGAPYLVLEVLKSNEIAHGIYKKFGFTEINEADDQNNNNLIKMKLERGMFFKTKTVSSLG